MHINRPCSSFFVLNRHHCDFSDLLLYVWEAFDVFFSAIAAAIFDFVLMNSARSAPTRPLKVLWLSSYRVQVSKIKHEKKAVVRKQFFAI